MRLKNWLVILAAAVLASACAATGDRQTRDPVLKLVSGPCSDTRSLTAAAPNGNWAAAEPGKRLPRACEQLVFRHRTRPASIILYLLPSPHSPLEFADAFAADHVPYDVRTGRGALMDRDQDGESGSWAFVHLQQPGPDGPDRRFVAYLRYEEMPGFIVVVVGAWPARVNQGLIFDLTDLVKTITFVPK